MTTRQKQLIEKYIRIKVNKALNEVNEIPNASDLMHGCDSIQRKAIWLALKLKRKEISPDEVSEALETIVRFANELQKINK